MPERAARSRAAPRPSAARPAPSRRPGPLRVLLALYSLFAVAACARAAVQLATKAGEAPLAYGLSAFAGLLYVVAAASLASRRPGARRVALVVCAVELAGVVIVGTLTLLDPAAFPDDTVWSGYGAGYGHLPLVLPALGLAWLALRPRARLGSAA